MSSTVINKTPNSISQTIHAQQHDNPILKNINKVILICFVFLKLVPLNTDNEVIRLQKW